MNTTLDSETIDRIAKALSKEFPKISIYISIAVAVVTLLAQLGTWTHLSRATSKALSRCVDVEDSPRRAPAFDPMVAPRPESGARRASIDRIEDEPDRSIGNQPEGDGDNDTSRHKRQASQSRQSVEG